MNGKWPTLIFLVGMVGAGALTFFHGLAMGNASFPTRERSCVRMIPATEEMRRRLPALDIFYPGSFSAQLEFPEPVAVDEEEEPTRGPSFESFPMEQFSPAPFGFQEFQEMEYSSLLQFLPLGIKNF
ncbi:MAG: hypothetical protein LBS68_03455 [Puniceicoccales bacterium]|jgi:hypothetical protein|nr:hypothetical protein [Puniceicoccales bacterium]